MTQRVRYLGPYPAAIFDSEAPITEPPLIRELHPGQWLPEKTDQGKPFPARIRDEFAHADNPHWAVVQADDKKGDN